MTTLKPLYVVDKKVLLMLSRGDTNADISRELGISRRTVEAKILRLRHEYGAKNTVHLIAILLIADLLIPKNTNSDKDSFTSNKIEESQHKMRINSASDLKKNMVKMINTHIDNL